jgi:hypothetical protein
MSISIDNKGIVCDGTNIKECDECGSRQLPHVVTVIPVGADNAEERLCAKCVAVLIEELVRATLLGSCSASARMEAFLGELTVKRLLDVAHKYEPEAMFSIGYGALAERWKVRIIGGSRLPTCFAYSGEGPSLLDAVVKLAAHVRGFIAEQIAMLDDTSS